MRKSCIFIALAMSLALVTNLMADPIPYPNEGVIAPTTSFIAVTSGPITAYFYDYEAAYHSTIGMLVNGVSTGLFGLPNHASSHGQSLVLGNVVAGDEVVFELRVQEITHSWFSDPNKNPDQSNHAYGADFSGDGLIPAGKYVGFEDLALGQSDFDYNDHQFVFTNVASPVPEASTFLLLGTGLGV